MNFTAFIHMPHGEVTEFQAFEQPTHYPNIMFTRLGAVQGRQLWAYARRPLDTERQWYKYDVRVHAWRVQENPPPTFVLAVELTQ